MVSRDCVRQFALYGPCRAAIDTIHAILFATSLLFCGGITTSDTNRSNLILTRITLIAALLNPVEQGSERGLKRQAFLAGGVAPTQLEHLFVRRRQDLGIDADSTEGGGQQRRAITAHGRDQ